MTVNATEGAIFKAGVPESLFQAFVVRGRREAVSDVLRWDVTPDGNRFLIDTAKAQPEPLTVVLNWDAGLKKK
jgi:hypothetical protein